MAPVRDPLPVSEELIQTKKWIHDTWGGLTMSSRANEFWLKSIDTGANSAPDATHAKMTAVPPCRKPKLKQSGPWRFWLTVVLNVVSSIR